MVKKTVEMVYCDTSGCNSSWLPLEGDHTRCLLCHKDVCGNHSFALTTTFNCRGMDAKYTLGVVCIPCKEEVILVLEGAEKAITERLTAFTINCVKQYASKVREEAED